MFRDYTESGPALLTDATTKSIGTFTLEDTNHVIANTLRRAVLMDTRSVGFRADLKNAADPGVVIRKNTSVIFNEMLAHRLTLVPLGVRDLDAFDASRYECILRVRNETKGLIEESGLLHVKAGDFIVRERQEDGTFVDLPAPAVQALFPADPITKDTALLVTLRPQWNAEQPAEEVDLTAYPIVGTGRQHMGLCPVSQCAYANTIDSDPVRQEQFFNDWMAAYKKVVDPSTLAPEVIENYRAEWRTMAIQRCFMVGPDGQPNSFAFTVESVGVRPVKDIVAEGIRAVIDLVSPYADADRSMEELGMSTMPVENRMNGIVIQFAEQEHTLGNLLQSILTEIYLDGGAPDSPITFAAYKVRHPLHRIMSLTLGFREGVAGDTKAIARQVIAEAAEKARQVFENLGRSWDALVGATATAGAGAAASAVLPEMEG